jgi:hypothetical protein
MYDYLTDLYDDCVLTVSGYQFLKMERSVDLGLLTNPDQTVFHYPVQYNIWLRKTN